MGIAGTVARFTDTDYPAIKLGSVGEHVKIWQKVLGIAQTGTFDSITELKTKEWQRGNGIIDDGVVGPLTWKAAGVKAWALTGDIKKTIAIVGGGAVLGGLFGGPIGAYAGGALALFGKHMWGKREGGAS